MLTEDKTSFARSVGASNSWDQFGIPELIVTDSGPAYISNKFRLACATLGISSDIAPAGWPQGRGHIERCFGSIGSSVLSRLPGRTFSSVAELGDYEFDKETVLDTDDLLQILIRWVVDIYHQKPQKSLNYETPQEAWKRLTRKYPPRQISAHLDKIVTFGEELSRTVTREGVLVFGVYYNSPELMQWMARNIDRSMTLKWLPSDVGSVAALIDDRFVELRPPKLDLAGVDYAKWEATKRHLRSNARITENDNSETTYAALDFIKKISNDACLRSELVVRDWSETDLKNAERGVFSDFSAVSPEPVLQMCDDGFGSIVTPISATAGLKTNHTQSDRTREEGVSLTTDRGPPELDDGELKIDFGL